MKTMQTASGVITLVQEHRFQLMDDSGRHRLFILSHNAPQEWSDLKRLEQANCPVTVFYTHASGLLAAAAHDVRQQGGRPGQSKRIPNEADSPHRR